MIYFFADDHYGAHPGKTILEHLPQEWQQKIFFAENDWSVLESGTWTADCELLILNMIGTTCGLPHPGSGAEKAVREWCRSGGNLLLLHGSSAAFWQWEWWRDLPGYRWVRPGDPDGAEPSTHPVEPYRVVRSKTRHPLIGELQEMDLPKDEIYTKLENRKPCLHLMETAIGGETFVQCCETITEWGGKIINFLPGHAPEAASNPQLIRNIVIFLNYLLKKEVL